MLRQPPPDQERPPNGTLDSLLPAEIALRAAEIGVTKCALPVRTLFVLGVLAGAFISLGAIFATTVAAGSSALPYGVARLLIGLVFSLGLILVIVGGAELFTGNNLIVMAWAGKKVTTRALLRNWSIVYAGNAVGALATAGLMVFSGQHENGAGSVGLAALSIADHKAVAFGFLQAVVLGILCNALVCLAVWLTFGARTVAGKISAILFPIAAFVAAGFEHCIANLYFVPYGIWLRQAHPEFASRSGQDLTGLDWSHFLIGNLLPVTLGNILGGAVLVALVYWFVYLQKSGD